ncbi:MAG: ABC transporter permease [Opitutales bacterium]
MRTLLTLIRKDLAVFLRNRAAVALTFLVPIALIYIFGLVFGLNRKDSGPTGFPLAVVNASGQPAASALVEALRAEPSFRVITGHANPDGTERPLTVDEARAAIRNREYRFALVLPADLIAGDRLGLHLQILSDPRNEIETQMINGLLEKTIFTSVPQLLGQSLQARAKDYLGAARLQEFNGTIAGAVSKSFGGDPEEIRKRMERGDFGLGRTVGGQAATGAGNNASPAGGALSQLVKIDREQVVGRDVKSPDATRIVGGWAMMFLLFALSNGAAAFFDEKNSGLFQRLLSAPVSRAQLLWSRFIYGVLLGLVQLIVLFSAGQVLYGIDVTGHLGGLLVVCTAAAAACTAFGMFVAAVSPNAQAAGGLATFLVLTMSATGGAWFPLSLMPEFMQRVGKFTLVYWAMEGFAQVLWAGDSLAALLPTVGVLVAIAAGVMGIAVWRFNRRRIFE